MVNDELQQALLLMGSGSKSEQRLWLYSGQVKGQLTTIPALLHYVTDTYIQIVTKKSPVL